MSDLVGNPEDRFSDVAAQIMSVMQWKSYPAGETKKGPIYWPGMLEGHKTNIIATIPLFSLIWIISLQTVCEVEMVGWIKGH